MIIVLLMNWISKDNLVNIMTKKHTTSLHKDRNIIISIFKCIDVNPAQAIFNYARRYCARRYFPIRVAFVSQHCMRALLQNEVSGNDAAKLSKHDLIKMIIITGCDLQSHQV